MAARAMDVAANVTPEERVLGDHHQKVQQLAYRLWLDRGSPIGSDQEDWFRAEYILNAESQEAVEEFAVST